MMRIWGPVSTLGMSVGIATLIADQAHKWWMLHVYRIQDRGRVRLTPYFDLVYAKNTGVSYSLFAADSAIGQLLLTLFALLAVLGMLIWLGQNEGRLAAVSLGLIMGGAVGNAIDRMVLGGVADFFSAHAFGFYWYIFNVADVAIVAGVAGLLYESLVLSRSDGVSRNDAAKPD